MTKNITISQDTHETVNIDEDGTRLLVEEGFSVTVSDGIGIDNEKYDDVHMKIDGHVKVDSTKSFAAISASGYGDVIHIGKHGSVEGPTAIQLQGPSDGEWGYVTNRGIISGTDYGIRGDDHGYYVENYGELTSTQGDAIALGAGDDVVRNRKVINGTIDTGDGDDYIDLLHGTVNGSILGGHGDDIYVATQKEAANVVDSGGHDLILTTHSYIADASQGIEDFAALASNKHIDLTGDDNDNELTGNQYRNHLSGGGGRDTISGEVGRDVLIGGADADLFIFHNRGDSDRITDFDATGADRDVIDFQNFGPLSFDELMSKAHDHDGYMIFGMGHGDRIILEGVTSDEITKANVQINDISLG